MNLYSSKVLFSYILLSTLLFNRKIAADRCIHDPKIILLDLVKEGEKLLSFRFPDNRQISVWEYVKNLINENFNAEEIWYMFELETLEQIMNQSTTHIETILSKTEGEKGENPCIEVLELCERDSHFDPSTQYIETEIIDTIDRDKSDFDQVISPLILTKKSVDDVIRNQNNKLSDEYLNEETKLQQTISQLVIQSVTLLRCEVKKSETRETISRFYYFTSNESGYPKFILKPITDSGNNYVYISSELLPYDDASSSTPNVEEENSKKKKRKKN